MAVPKVAAIHDLSGLGRCALTAAIPILAAMGVQACPLATAVFSNQTGYSSYICFELSRNLESFAGEWKRHKVRFQGIYTGFLLHEEQAVWARHFVREFREEGTLVLVDPVLGDDGTLFPVFRPGIIKAMAELVAAADVITPNITEACLLTGTPCDAVAGAEDELIWRMTEQLASMGPRIVVITGVVRGDMVSNFAWLAEEKRRVHVSNRRVGNGYSGAGDVLASVLCGGLVRGDGVEVTLQKAAGFLERAVARTYADGTDPNEGIAFEPHLHLLTNQGGQSI